MAAVEDRHFWFVGTRGVVRDQLVRVRLPVDADVLDVGCGTGGTMRALADVARFTGLDVNPDAARVSQRHSGRPVVVGNATDLPFGDATFDALLALDVFEHVPDDARALAEARRVLRPGGTLILTVPCHPSLFSEHDVALHHVRRYTRPQILGRVGDAGFGVVRATWIMGLLFPAAAAHRLAQRVLPGHVTAHSDAAIDLAPVNAFLTAVMQLERRLIARTDLPMGLGMLVVAR